MNLQSFFACLVAGVFIAFCAFYTATRGPLAGSPGWTMEGLVTVILASVTVVLAAIGVFVALLTIWGYNKVLDEAKITAERAVTDVATRVALETVNSVVPRMIEARLDALTETTSEEMAEAFARDGGENGDGK